MKNFKEWLEQEHPETIEEGFFKNLALGSALAAGAMGMAGKFNQNTHHAPSRTTASQSQDDDFDDEVASVQGKDAKLRAAADRVGIPKNRQNNLKGHMVGGIVIMVNGKKVPLTPKEANHVRAVQNLARSMGN